MLYNMVKNLQGGESPFPLRSSIPSTATSKSLLLYKMKKTLHTPGPWGFKPVETCNDNPCRWEILGGVGVIAETNDHTTDANARLIAAGPDLLSALEFLLADYIAINGENLTGSSVPADKAREALRKAKGEA
jgi:hypothetical protein